MNKSQERVLRETIRAILKEETLDEGRFLDWVKDRVGIPRRPSLHDMGLSPGSMKIIGDVYLPSLERDWARLAQAFWDAHGRGLVDPEVRRIADEVKERIWREHQGYLPNYKIMGLVGDIMKSAERAAQVRVEREG